MPIKRKRSASEEELMTDSNISKVIKLLEPQEQGAKPITKKDACQMLGMSYNTTRLATIIDQFKQKQARTAQRKAELRGKPITQNETVYIISEYLNGETVESISKTTYRSSGLIRKVLEDNAVPLRVTGHSYFKPELIPEASIRTRFNLGEVVYSARYDSPAKIDAEQETKHGFVYRIWLLSDKWMQFAYQEATELASLEHLRQLGVKI